MYNHCQIAVDMLHKLLFLTVFLFLLPFLADNFPSQSHYYLCHPKTKNEITSRSFFLPQQFSYFPISAVSLQDTLTITQMLIDSNCYFHPKYFQDQTSLYVSCLIHSKCGLLFGLLVTVFTWTAFFFSSCYLPSQSSILHVSWNPRTR